MPELERRYMRREDRGPVLDLLGRCFGSREPFRTYLDTDPAFRFEDVLLATAGGQPISCVQIFSKRIRLRGETVALGGIGSVATHPDHRRRGLARRLLRDAIADMERRGMALSLLFSGVRELYGPLGWVTVPQPRLALHRPEAPPEPPRGTTLRAFRDADLPQVRALYDAYCAELDGTTVRDETYWRGQLRYAGSPDELFRVAERAGRVVAYARVATPPGISLMEFARAPDAADALCALVLEAIPAGKALIGPVGRQAELASLLRAAGARVDPVADEATMWRVLNANLLTRLAGSGWDRPTLLETLVTGPRTLYWPSDRF